MLIRTLANSLERLGAGDASRLIVASSGGLDSSVLLHALTTLDPPVPLLAVHVNHGLQDSALLFEEHAKALCESLSVPLTVHHVTVDCNAGLGPEAAARQARYAVFESILETGDCILSAHHQDDQAETLLLHLMRASGPRGLSGVPEKRSLGRGWVLRPLLSESRASLLAYAKEHGVAWAEDPSNTDMRFDRNFLRQQVMPLLESRFPSTGVRLARSAALQLEAQSILDEVAESDLASAGGDPSRLPIAVLSGLPQARQSNLLRACLRRLTLGEPGFARLQTILLDLMTARPDAAPLVQWDTGEARAYRGYLYLMARQEAPTLRKTRFDGNAIAELGVNGRMCLQPSSGVGLDPGLCEQTLEIRYRVGGERLRPVGDSHERSLKSLLQAHAIVPWMRDRVPLIYDGDRLLAVADLWLNQECCAQNGLQPVWQDRPSLH